MHPTKNASTDFERQFNPPKVSVIVVMYNQTWTELIKTLDSIVCQERIDFEIIVCDDGSEKKFENELNNYFFIKGFCHYSLILHGHNGGTVSNYYSGLEAARGKYAKLISPGDYLVGSRTLYEWTRFMEENNAEWSFSDTIYYRFITDREEYISTSAKPQFTKSYVKGNKARCMWNYLALRDAANGAAVLGLTELQKQYCGILKEKGIIYCEDYIYRLMVFHEHVGTYFPKAAVGYRFASGVSSSHSTIWKDKLQKDKNTMIQVLLSEKADTKLKTRIKKAIIRSRKAGRLNTLLIRGNIMLRLKRHFFPRLTPLPEDVGSNHL